MSETSTNTSKSHFSYEEGHKRETRKSYQNYIDQLMESNTGESSSATCDETSDDNNVRRSRRTPVPKRNFKLIDGYDTKEPAKKKTKGAKESKEKEDKKSSLEQQKSSDIKQEPDDLPDEAPKQKEEHETDEVAPRKSSRAHKPKKFEDSVALPYIKKPQVNKVTDKDLTEEKVTKSRRKSKDDIPQVFLSPAEAAKLKKSRKSISEVTKPDMSPSTSRRRKTKEEPLKTPEKTKASPVKKTSKRKKNASDVDMKQEVDASDASQLDTSQESPKKKKPMYESYVTTGSKKYVPPVNEENDITPAVGALVESSIHKESKKKKKKKKTENDKKNKKDDNASPKKTKKGENTHQKLIVSFRKSLSASDKKKKGKFTDESVDTVVDVPITLIDSVAEDAKSSSHKKKKNKKKQNEIIKSEETIDTAEEKQTKVIDETVDTVNDLPTTPIDSVGEDLKSPSHKKKNKKKTKKKLDHKNQKVIDVKTFPVEDNNIMKVKKKKIYKKRNDKKVLVRIIKNHCNKSGEIVKTETVLVDNVPVEDDTEKKGDEVAEEDHTEKKGDRVAEEMDLHSSEENFDFPTEENGDVVFEGNNSLDEQKSGEEALQAKRTVMKKSSKKSLKKIVAKKTSTKVQKKALSRPANKNVTVGGKVVGKTTKGMKKTGVAVLDGVSSKSPVKRTTENQIDASIPTEPKNAYNLFCRKYRPIIVQQHPKADFAEISRRLAALWNTASTAEKQEHRERFNEIQSTSRAKLYKLNRSSPSHWTDAEFKYIKKAISENEPFSIPPYSLKRLQPVDFAAHLQLLGDSLTVIAGALEQQAAMTVHGAMSVLMDSILCALAPLLFLTSQIPEMASIEDEQQARTLDNVAYILPGL